MKSKSVKSKIALTLLGCCYSAFTFAACNVGVDMVGNNITNIGTASLSAAQSTAATNDLVTRGWVSNNFPVAPAYETFVDSTGHWVNIPAYTMPGTAIVGNDNLVGNHGYSNYTVPAFSVMKYEAKIAFVEGGTSTFPPAMVKDVGNFASASSNTVLNPVANYMMGNVVDPRKIPAAYSTPLGRSRVENIQFAIPSCNSVGGDVINLGQRYSIVRQAMSNAANWYSGAGITKSAGVGQGYLPSGRSSGTAANPSLIGAASDTSDTDVYYNTNVAANSTSAPWYTTTAGNGGEQIRVIYLGNSKIWDFAGNAWEMTSARHANQAFLPDTFGAPQMISNVSFTLPDYTVGANEFIAAYAPFMLPFISTDGSNVYNPATDTVFTQAGQNVGTIGAFTYTSSSVVITGGGMELGLNGTEPVGTPIFLSGITNVNGLFSVAAVLTDFDQNRSYGYRCTK